MMDPWLENFARRRFRRSGDTAHDLKTPLNVAVLNLELLRMRIAKLASASDDETRRLRRRRSRSSCAAWRGSSTRSSSCHRRRKKKAAPRRSTSPTLHGKARASGFEIDPAGRRTSARTNRIRQALRCSSKVRHEVLKPEDRQASAAQRRIAAHFSYRQP